MTWGRRLKLYLIGFGIGLVICFILFRNRNLSDWFPSSHVKNFISLSKKIDADSSLLCKLKCEGISMEDIRKASVDGDVDFGKSNTSKEPAHEYDVTMTLKGKKLEFYIAENMNDSTAKILMVNPPLNGESCGCK